MLSKGKRVSKEKEWDDVDKATKLLIGMRPVKHERSKKPKKEDLERRFSLRKDQKGNPKIVEVK